MKNDFSRKDLCTVQVDIRSGFLMKNYIVYTATRIYDMSIENKCLQSFQIKLNHMIITFDYNHHFLVDTKRKEKIIDSMNLIQRLMSTWWTNRWSQMNKINFLIYFDGLLNYLIHRFLSKLKKSKSKIPPQITVNNVLMTQKWICFVYHTIHICA